MTKTTRARTPAFATTRAIRGTFGALTAVALLLAMASAAQAAPYTFTKVADSARDNFNPNSFTCSTINNRGDIAFKAGRTSPDGLNSFDGIYRANADGTLTTIAEDPNRERFGFLGNNPSMNDLGDVSFAANLAPDFEAAILRGNGTELVTIATTVGEFNFFGFNTSINNSREVAFKGELDHTFDEGLFSGSGGKITTHYLNSRNVSLDGRPARFGGNDSRPSINNVGDIAFDESVQPDFASGIFVGRERAFRTISAPNPNGSAREPVLNDVGTTAFETTFFDETGRFVDAIVTDNGPTQTRVADTSGSFIGFFRPPSINNAGNVAFGAFLNDNLNSGIFTGPDAKKDAVITTADKLDGGPILSGGLRFCEEGLNDFGELGFIAEVADPDNSLGRRTAVFRATPKR